MAATKIYSGVGLQSDDFLMLPTNLMAGRWLGGAIE